MNVQPGPIGISYKHKKDSLLKIAVNNTEQIYLQACHINSLVQVRKTAIIPVY